MVKQEMSQRSSLYQQIKEYKRGKKILGVSLIGLGMLGLLLPVLPGMALMGLGLWLLFPKESEVLLNKVKKMLRYKES